MRWSEIISESTRPSWLGVDNPGGEWLERAKEKCRQDPRGIRGNSTGYTKRAIKVLLDKLIKVAGYNGEHKFRHLSSPKRDALLKSVDATGFDNRDYPILVGVGVDGQPYIMEGNHRTSVAFGESKQFIWATVQWYGGSESLDGEWSPAALQHDWDKLESRKAIDEAFEPKDITWDRKRDCHIAYYEVNLQEFQGHFVQSDAAQDVWDYAFMAIKASGEPTISNTGELGSRGLEAFGYAVSSIEQFLINRKPAFLRFSGDKGMGKADLYEKMAKRLKPRVTTLGYRIAVDEMDHERTFVLEKIN